ncbi:hypothetical protein COS31_05265 [Candidatus Roizmanbacteria bacterium CG02_land_8_20_14_3_00_36_15]|uniref:Uncharacterized protein n=3 Tax=Candidatus Roizmaniibacteriota TaxID=1752723 RepID=A0A2H0BYH9_9BACT|nr:MAG: hypothetical protein COW98_02275 [Candidatus Roizmanbacteria bacterium CG22_combo_CG10-13_8_21_14_all_35_9]PIV09559.1 MAG: hypothetical protein COS51_02465 [Candidatus Roizmanbacteria bacterium CG03_land_8_20_14_0_80_36_21]PIV37341.1 MAG: hypothetical protein COS31_05265 [Candidatus Roizmanbacteria bacterium CG02_land_8_20_14_3_00_36_15]PIY69761.1 MAG: hypothetical protein COY89_04575 [Candidatus Roizmanbacteria bacterium CG_4_10_14_0_8_um_filter_36_36]PJA53170.1 MAG: hypothetical prote
MKAFVNHCLKEIKRHLFDYLLLITAGVFFIAAVNLFRGERLTEFIILLIFISFYIIWGIYHHIVETGFQLRIMIEYIFIGLVILFLLKLIILP